MKTDIVEVMEACIDGRLDELSLEFEDNAAVCRGTGKRRLSGEVR